MKVAKLSQAWWYTLAGLGTMLILILALGLEFFGDASRLGNFAEPSKKITVWLAFTAILLALVAFFSSDSKSRAVARFGFTLILILAFGGMAAFILLFVLCASGVIR